MRNRFLLLCLVLGLAACRQDGGDRPAAEAASSEHPAEKPGIPFDREGTLDFVREGASYLTIDIEIAETDSARMRGLMQRASLPERSGMLFLFDREEPQSFWMANTPLALDLIFVGADSQIVSIAKYTRPLSDEQIESGLPAQYVVEVPAGFTDTHDIIEADRVRWRRTGE